ncbi:hypothetical protein CHS0354_008208 [Potamilus streckersoni]|uniref:Uncharacterized protein n=1 Tax=Potamilus streckersoni TaxID=2493646 RepID=A0AAE0VJT9_9BIVA|nr:hypothetical protein CHS0354_008208 [Potamilus streckersoni]
MGSILSLLSSAKETALKEPLLLDDIQSDPFSLYRTDGNDLLLGLYQDITKTDLSVPSNSSNIHQVEEAKLHYICHQYKVLFLEDQWLRICEFEEHFQSNIGEETVSSIDSDLHLISLRECHLILFLDNSLQKRAEPCRGSNHKTQICTLPITVKGLPKDNEVTLDWHLEECEGDPKCGCKDRLVLNKNDMARCIFNLSEEETAMHTLLTQHIFWDLNTIITTSSTFQNLINNFAERSTIAIKGNEISSMLLIPRSKHYGRNHIPSHQRSRSVM